MAAEFASSIATTIFDHSLGAIVRHVGYLWNHKKNMTNLKAQVKKLDDVRDDKIHTVLVAERNAERIRSQAKSWQNDAEKISSEARNIMELYEEIAKKRCLIGLCPNVVSHYKLSRKACKKRLEIGEAVEEANQLNVVSDRAVRRAFSIPSTEGLLPFDSRNSILEEIMETMKDASKNSIGVYGLGGIGKTTLAKQVASRAAEEKLFDEIVMAPVTQKPDLKEIQGEMAKKLGLKLEESTVAERAGRIHGRLKERKVLVILDDLWEKLDLKKVGIPFGPEHKGCKLLFTSRSRDVLFSMGIKKDFNVEALGDKEAWSLFAEKTVDVIKDPAFLSAGKEVAKKCAGLPVLIVTVAASLSNRPTLPAWKDALKELKKMNNKDVHEIVNSALESISYKHLQKTHKRLFLLCGLHGSGFHISDLLKHSWGWNFFDEDVVTLEEARNKLHALILDLKESCLLLDGDDEDIIKIHDVVRGVAISLARKDKNMLCVGDDDTELIRWPNDDALRSCTAMYFEDCRDFSCLPERLECPLLEYFNLVGISLDASSTIPGTFFQKTRELKVLDMTNLCFSGLPSSISFLENLQTLCLDFCTNLEDISIVGELKKLQVLSFMGSDIEELPREIGQLCELRLLDLTRCWKLKIIPAGLLAGLSNLEELYMRNSFNKWEAEEFHSSNSESSSNASLAELKQLPKLCSLEIDVEDAKLLSQYLNFERLERYRIIAGGMRADREIDKKGFSRRLGVNHLENGIKGLKRAECLCLEEVNGIKNIINELDRDGFTELKHLNIQTDYDIQFIVNVELKQQMVFPALESLYLSDLSKLEKICNGRLMQDSFGKLTSAKVRNCNQLESLFSFTIAIGLPCLQELRVSDCSILKGIVAKKSGDEEYNDAISEKIEFGQLRKLSLKRLPQLRSFYCSVKEKQKYMKTGAQSEEIISEEEEPSSVMSLFKEVSFPSLEKLTLFEITNLTEIWNRPSISSFKNLKELRVENCDNLKYLFTPSITMGLVQLQELRIKSCARMKKIVVKEDGETMDAVIFLQLSSLCLEDLPNLTTFYSGDEEMGSNENTAIQPLFNDKANFSNLERLSVIKCGSLKYLFAPYGSTSLVRLQQITVQSCLLMKEIIISEKGKAIDAIIFPQLRVVLLEDLPDLIQPLFNEKANFPSLEDLSVKNCMSLKYLFTPCVAMGLVQLQQMIIEKCPMMKNIITDDEGETTNTITLPHLSILCFSDLPNLTAFYSGNEEMCSNENVHIGLQPLFNDKVNLPVLKRLKINNLDNIESIWHNQANEEDSCCKLEAVEVGRCAKLLNIFPSAMLNKIQSVKEVRIFYCEALEEVFEVHEGLNLKEITYDITTVSQLRDLRLTGLPKLRFVWRKDVHKIFSFENLCKVEVCVCEGLKSVFPACVAQRLHQLERLLIYDCMEVETIVEEENDGDHENKEVSVCPPTFTFPKLTELSLSKLPKVECFYPKKHASEWPLLKVLEVNDCHQISILDFLPLLGKQEHNQFQKLVSQLERLTIRSKDVKMMRRQHSELFLVNLKRLTLSGFDGDESAAAAAFPSNFLYALHNLETLEVMKSSLGEIFPYEEGQEEILSPSLLPLLPNLTTLWLENMRELKYICTQNSPFFHILNQLHHLYVIKCPRLTNLVPTGSVSFKFLKHLTVTDCGGLINLIPSSTAASLEQLRMLTIRGCSMIEEIVAADDSQQDHHHIILIFPNLKYLLLEDLPRLTNFYTDNNYTFKFPQLERVSVYKCPNMSTFSPGITITPKLEKVSFEEDAKLWKGDLNTTIQHHFSQMEPQRLTTTDPSTSSNNHVEPEGCIHEKPTESLGKEAEEIREEFTEPRNDGVGELGKKAEIPENVMKPENETEVCEHVVEPREGVGFFEKCNEPRNGTDICEEVVDKGKVADSCEKGKGKELDTESRNSEKNWNGDNNTTGQHLYLEMETPRLTAADPTTSEPQPQIHDNPTESAANEIQEISEESTKQREEGQTTEPAKTENNIDPIEEIGVLEQPNDPIIGQKVDICGGATKPGKGKEKIEIREEAVVDSTGNEAEIWSHPYSQTHASSTFRSTVLFYQLGKSSVPSEMSEETTPLHSNPSILSPANEPDEQTNTQLLAPQDVVASSSSPTSNHPETSPSLVTEEAGTSRAASNSQQNDFQKLCARKGFITLLSEFLQIYQTQPLDSISIDQGQLMVDAFRDLTNVNFSIEWFSPYVEKVKDRLEKKKEISELELKIAEKEAQLQALKEKKKALEEKIISPQELEDS